MQLRLEQVITYTEKVSGIMIVLLSQLGCGCGQITVSCKIKNKKTKLRKYNHARCTVKDKHD